MFELFKFIALFCGSLIMLSGTVVLVMLATSLVEEMIEEMIEDYVSSANKRKK